MLLYNCTLLGLYSTELSTDAANLMQVIYQIIGAYFKDDYADELTHEPVMSAILDKNTLASKPTLSRFFNRMDTDTLVQFNLIVRELRKVIYL